MNAKQERAHHLELHKMKRTNNELSNYNAALEAECNHLRRVSEKYAAENDALSKQHAIAMETERVKMNALQLEFTQETQLRFKQLQANNDAQHQNALSDAKRRLDAALNEHRAALDAAIQKLNEERTQMKQNDLMREREYKQLAEQLTAQHKTIMNEERTQMKQNDLMREREYKQLSEQLAAQHKTIMDEERTQMKHNDLMREREYKQLSEQLAAQYKTIMDEGIEEKRRQEAHFNSKLNEERTRLQEQAQAEMENTQRKLSADLVMKLDASISESLHDAVTSNCTHMQWMNALDFRGKRVMLYSHYSESNEVQDYNVLTIECMQHYFDHIIVLTNCPNKWNMRSPNYNQCHLLNYNMKSDFRNYGVFIMQLETSLVNASRLCLTNDSFIVVDVNAFSICIKRLFDREPMSHDFVGLTSSYENVYHLQSYFMCFGGTAIPAVVSYFKTHGLPFNHADAIGKYELGMSLHLTNLGLTSFALVTNNDMKRPLNTTCCKWSNVLEETGIVKRQNFLKKYAYAGMTDKDIAKIAENHAYNAELLQFLKCNNVRAFTPR
jgi:hypothetical protein